MMVRQLDLMVQSMEHLMVHNLGLMWDLEMVLKMVQMMVLKMVQMMVLQLD